MANKNTNDDEIIVQPEGEYYPCGSIDNKRYEGMSEQQEYVQIVDKTIVISDPIAVVCGDENSQMIGFQMNRYYDNVDLSSENKHIQILYRNTNGTFVDNACNVVANDVHLRFSWVLPVEFATLKGNVLVAIQITGKDEFNNNYVWKTSTTKIAVQSSLAADDSISDAKSWYVTINDKVDSFEERLDNILALSEDGQTFAELPVASQHNLGGVKINPASAITITTEGALTFNNVNHYATEEKVATDIVKAIEDYDVDTQKTVEALQKADTDNKKALDDRITAAYTELLNTIDHVQAGQLDNSVIVAAIDTYLQENPIEAMSQEEIEALVQEYIDGLDISTDIDLSGYVTTSSFTAYKEEIEDLINDIPSGSGGEVDTSNLVTTTSFNAYKEEVANSLADKVDEDKVLDLITESDISMWYPSIDDDGIISWTKTNEATIPQSINIKGEKGDTGLKGDKGDSFEYSDFTTEQLLLLKGDKGDKGDKGEDGTNGADGSRGDDGDSAYDIAVNNGFVGTETEWLASLKGEQGIQGDSGLSEQEIETLIDEKLSDITPVDTSEFVTTTSFAAYKTEISDIIAENDIE